MTKKQFCKLATMMLLGYATVSVGAQEIVSVDGRIREVYYSGSGVVEIPTASGFSTTVEFADKETVQTVVSGDTAGWTVVPQGSRIFIKQNIDPAKKTVRRTNLTIITDKRNYYMNVYSTTQANAAFVIRYRYDNPPPPPPPLPPTPANIKPAVVTVTESEPVVPRGKRQQAATSATAVIVKPGYINRGYSLSGSDNISVDKVYDDGVKTYFEMSPRIAVPEVYMVNAAGYDVPITDLVVEDRGTRNNRFKRITVPGVNNKFTLRSGTDYRCIINDSNSELYKPKK